MGVLVNEEGFPRGGVKRHQKSPCSNHYDPWNHRDRAQHLPAGQTLLPEEASRDDVEGAHAPQAVLPIDDGVPTSDVEPASIPGTGGDAPISQVWIGASPGDGRSPHRPFAERSLLQGVIDAILVFQPYAPDIWIGR